MKIAISVNTIESNGMIPMTTVLTAFRQWDFFGLLVCDFPYSKVPKTIKRALVAICSGFFVF